MRGGSILKHQLTTGVVDLWQISSIELGAEGEIGVIKMRSLSSKNTIDNEHIEVVAPSNMVSALIASGIIEVYDRAGV